MTRQHNERSSRRRDSGERGDTSSDEEPEARVPPEFAAAEQFSKYERNWIRTHLAPFYVKELIVDVVQRVKAGKEATVYICTGHPSSERPVVAAKLYRESSLRGAKNTAEYEEGRAALAEDGGERDFKTRRGSRHSGEAGGRKPARGVAATQSSWLMHEFRLLQQLHAAGGDVPEPIEHAEQALLMEFIGDGMQAAPTLSDITLLAGEAKPLFERVVFNIELLLGMGWVHGDLSAYNILYHQGRVVLIDFPQVVNCKTNPKARAIFERDVERVAQCFSIDERIDHARLARQLWEKYVPKVEPQ